MHRDDHDLHAIVDHELDDEGMRTTLGRLAADRDAAARCAAYTEQRAALTSLREGLGLSLPARSLAELEGELRAVVQRRKQVRLAVAVGGAMAFVGRHRLRELTAHDAACRAGGGQEAGS